MTEKEVMRRAAERISDPSRWCQGALARDKYGNRLSPLDPNACSWCAVGSICREVGQNFATPSMSGYFSLFHDANPETNLHISSMNDECDHATILKAMLRAAE